LNIGASHQLAIPPSHARYKAVAFTIALAIITYLDRICIAQAAPYIARDLTLSPKQMGWVFAAFGIPYALFEVPTGWLGDRYGPRSILIKVVLFWSFFTAATGLAWNLMSLLICRALFGAGESGCFPNITKIFTIWLPTSERSPAQGILWFCARWGGAFTPLLVASVLAFIDWRWVFVLFGMIGVFWAVAFWRWFRDDPAEHPSVNAGELAMLDGARVNAPSRSKVPWGRMLSSGTVWLLWLQFFCMSYGWYFYITWLPTYLRDARGVALGASALLAGFPLFLGGFGCLAGGWISRWLAVRWSDVRRGRKVVACAGLFSAAALLILATKLDNPVSAMAAIGFAGFSNDLAMAPDWTACMDIGGRWSGSLSGSMNMVGNLGGAVGPAAVGYILDSSKSQSGVPTPEAWTMAFLVAAAVYVVGAIAWMFIDPVTPLEE
jgi:MFS transporter, ACS family, glucarate transporter